MFTKKAPQRSHYTIWWVQQARN